MEEEGEEEGTPMEAVGVYRQLGQQSAAAAAVLEQLAGNIVDRRRRNSDILRTLRKGHHQHSIVRIGSNRRL